MFQVLNPGNKADVDRYLMIHIATTCDEHEVYFTNSDEEQAALFGQSGRELQQPR